MTVAEFDSGGFSAVASFFGDVPSTSSSSENKDVSKQLTKSQRKRGRLGLGATGSVTTETSETNNNSQSVGLVSETREQILKIGRSKRKRHGEEEEDEFDDSLVETRQQGDDDEDDDEEEEGRTSAVRVKPKSTTEHYLAGRIDALANATKKKKKKKKKGKKERLKEESQASNTSITEEDDRFDKGNTDDGYDATVPHTSTTNDSPTNHDEDNAKDTPNGAAADIDAAATDGAATTIPKKKTNKRKKPKIRSKQKNIRKDGRSSSEKPEHLIFGKSTYAGRPLTKETREVLKLPESSIFRRLHRHKTGVTSSSSSGGGNWNEPLGLGVDDLLGDDNGNDVGVSADALDLSKSSAADTDDDVHVQEKTGKKQSAGSTKKKKKKSKYKNLR